MKAKLIVLAAAAAFSFQKLDVPSKAKAHLASTYHAAQKVKWDKEGKGYEAHFKLAGKQCSATYQADGTFKEAETAFQENQMPPAVVAAAKAKQPKAKFTEFARIVTAQSDTLYEVEARIGAKSQDLLFHADGTAVQGQ